MKDILCPKTNTACPAKVLLAELEDGNLRSDNVEGNPNNTPSGSAAKALAETARKLLDEGECSVGPGFEIVDETARGEEGEVNYTYSIDSCTNSKEVDLADIGFTAGINITYIYTDLPDADAEG